MTRIGRNTATLLAFAAVDGALGWVQLKWLAVHWGASGMGLFAVLFSLGAVLMLVFSPGLPLLVTRWTAAHGESEHSGEAARVALACSAYAAVTGTAAALLVFAHPEAAGRWWAALLPASPSLPWVTLFFASTALRQILFGVWNGQRRMELPALVDLAQILVVTARMFTSPELRLEDFFRWNALSSCVATLWCAGMLIPGLLRAAGGSRRQGGSEGLRAYAFWSGLTAVTALGFDYLDRLALASRLSTAEVSYFHVPARWLQFLRRLLGQPLQALFPELARGPLETRRLALGAFVEGYTLLGLGAGLALALSPAAFIHLLTSPEFDRGVPVLKVLALVPPLMGLYAPLTTALRAEGSMRQGAISDLLWVGIYLLLGAVLIGPMGPVGLAWGQVAASLGSLIWNVQSGHQRGWLQLPAGALVRQWALAAVTYAACARLPQGESSLVPAAAGCVLFAILHRLTGGLSPQSKAQIHPRLPASIRGLTKLLVG